MDVLYAVDWWTTVPPLKTFLRDEAESFQKLLNTGNDFQMDLQKLAQQQLSKTTIQRVQVASIGTSGMWLKAAVANKDGNDDDKPTILDVPIPFLDGKEATTADDLRESVLTLVESVENVSLDAKAAQEEEVEPIAEPQSTEKEEIATEAEEEEVPIKETEPEPLSKEERIITARRQPKPAKEEAALAAKYAAIEDVGERAYIILVDLGMI